MSLPKAPPHADRLGIPTIMDPALAARHGVPYVHAAAFAIDVDRVRNALEEAGASDELPFAWEVFLTEAYLVWQLDPRREETRALLEDACLSVLDLDPGELVLGAQLPFAVWDAVARGVWPETARASLRAWKARPKELVRDLAPCWADERALVARLARVCLEAPMQPPLAPPTVEALRALARDTGDEAETPA